MKNILNIIKTDVKLMFREKMMIFWIIVLPIIFIIIFGNQKQPVDSKASLSLINADKGKWGDYFAGKLEDEKIKITVVKSRPEKFIRILFIPDDFSAKIEQRKSQVLKLDIKENGNFGATKKVEMKITKAIAELITELIIADDQQKMVPGKKIFEDLVTVRSVLPEESAVVIPSGKDHTIPGTLLMFIMMNILIYGGAMINFEKKKGLIPRMMFSPLSVSQLWISKMAARVILGMIQTLILITAGILIFDMNLGDPLPALIIVIVFSISVSGLSIFFGSVLSKEEVVIGISILAAQVFAGLGGCWWPIEIVPDMIRKIGMLTPTYWAMDAFHGLIFFHRSFADILPNLAILLIFTLLFATLSIRFFRIKD